MAYYQVQIDVRVHDVAELRAFALARAVEAGISKADFIDQECDDPQDNVEYWLGWVFDAGTPEGCGIEIEDSRAVYEGDA